MLHVGARVTPVDTYATQTVVKGGAVDDRVTAEIGVGAGQRAPHLQQMPQGVQHHAPPAPLPHVRGCLLRRVLPQDQRHRGVRCARQRVYAPAAADDGAAVPVVPSAIVAAADDGGACPLAWRPSAR
jgi:hypothetical protein